VAHLAIRAADGGSFDAYLAAPQHGASPGIVVIQEIFGVNRWLRGVADAAAAQGYVAIAPDLYWRLKPGIELDSDREDEFKKGVGYMQRFDEEKGVADLKAGIAALRQHPACTGKVGSLGYCIGGRLAFLLACGADTDANVAYYGVNIDAALGEAGGIAHPLLLHIAERDKFVPPAAQRRIEDGLRGNPHVTIHSYAGADHGFARSGSHAYERSAADLANSRTIQFFRRTLGG
jgi:carboxymethylenebutenolidase